MFALNSSCAPPKNPQQGQLEELSVMPQGCRMSHCCLFLAERALECISWGNSFPEASSGTHSPPVTCSSLADAPDGLLACQLTLLYSSSGHAKS